MFKFGTILISYQYIWIYVCVLTV